MKSRPTDLPPADDDCPLKPADQKWNIGCFAAIYGLFYLGAPVSYIGITHANLLDELRHDKLVLNLPSAVYQWTSVCSVLAAWFLPQARLLKPLMLASLSAMTFASAAVAAALGLGSPSRVVTAVVIAHGAIFGAANGVLLTTMWELVRRGVSTARRGQALGLTFAVGPLLACAGASGQQALFSSDTGWAFSPGYSFPTNYLVLFAAAVPIFGACVGLGCTFVAPPAANEAGGTRRAEIAGGLRDFFTSRPLVLGAVAYLLVYSGGNAIMQNASVYAKQMLAGGADTQGIQQLLRFGCKAAAGAFLGWLLTRTNPKAALLATTSILLAAMAWALLAQGRWFLFSFGLFGAGELFGAYFPNYIATASPKSRVRLNVAYLTMLGALVGLASVGYGWIADRFGLLASFAAAAGVLVLAVALVVIALPARPVPREG